MPRFILSQNRFFQYSTKTATAKIKKSVKGRPFSNKII